MSLLLSGFEEFYSSNASVHCKIWNIFMMVLKPSPYLTPQSMEWAEYFISGDSRDCDNPFQWSKLCPNLTVDSKYSTSLPWVSKITK